MTPNKLPPLPEISDHLKVIECLWQSVWRMPLQYANTRFTYGQIELALAAACEALEAIRQSQPLPAGAVAGLPEDRKILVYRLEQMAQTPLNYESSLVREAIEALQADAREKGEAVPAYYQYGYKNHCDGGSAYICKAGSKAHSWLSDTETYWNKPLYFATQPAQASEPTVLVGGVAHTYRDDVIKPVGGGRRWPIPRTTSHLSPARTSAALPCCGCFGVTKAPAARWASRSGSPWAWGRSTNSPTNK